MTGQIAETISAKVHGPLLKKVLVAVIPALVFVAIRVGGPTPNGVRAASVDGVVIAESADVSELASIESMLGDASTTFDVETIEGGHMAGGFAPLPFSRSNEVLAAETAAAVERGTDETPSAPDPDFDVTAIIDGPEQVAVVDGRIRVIGSTLGSGWTLLAVDGGGRTVTLMHGDGSRHTIRLAVRD